MELNKRQNDILYGMVFGDAYVQKTGSVNARLRVEHSLKQKSYVYWKYQELETLFQSEPQFLRREHPLSHRTYQYLRLQSYASPFLGNIRQQFYGKNGKKRLPKNLSSSIASSLTIAVWYMDDGYYDKRDRSAHIFLQAFQPEEIQQLIHTFQQCHDIECTAYCRPDRKTCQLNFRNIHKDKLFKLIEPHLISEMRYKTPFMTP